VSAVRGKRRSLLTQKKGVSCFCGGNTSFGRKSRPSAQKERNTKLGMGGRVYGAKVGENVRGKVLFENWRRGGQAVVKKKNGDLGGSAIRHVRPLKKKGAT